MHTRPSGLPRGSICVSSSYLSRLNPDDAWSSLDGLSWFILDIETDPEERAIVIPFDPRAPYAGTSRSEVALQYTTMLPTFFIRRGDGGAGIPVAAGRCSQASLDLVNGDRPFDHPRTSLKIRFSVRAACRFSLYQFWHLGRYSGRATATCRSRKYSSGARQVEARSKSLLAGLLVLSQEQYELSCM